MTWQNALVWAGFLGYLLGACLHLLGLWRTRATRADLQARFDRQEEQLNQTARWAFRFSTVSWPGSPRVRTLHLESPNGSHVTILALPCARCRTASVHLTSNASLCMDCWAWRHAQAEAAKQRAAERRRASKMMTKGGRAVHVREEGA